MCGIFAYLNCGVPKTRKEIVEKLLVGLKRLEYRGYDSAGFAVDESDEEGDEDAQNGRGRARKEKKTWSALRFAQSPHDVAVVLPRRKPRAQNSSEVRAWAQPLEVQTSVTPSVNFPAQSHLEVL